MAFTDDTPFIWGSNGARLTPDEIASRRKVADALAAQGSDASPFPAGTRGAGTWTQGLARVAKGVQAGLVAREANEAASANAADNKAMIAALLSGGGQSAGAPMDITPSGAATAPSAPSAAASDSPRGIRNNNPLNIEDGSFAQSQPGYAGTDGRFAKFESPDHGVAAADTLLNTYQTKHGLNTVAGIVGRWAPAGDGNNVSAYAADVAKQLGIDPNAPLTAAQRPALIAAMGRHENGVPIQMPTAAPVQAPVQVASNGPVEIPSAPTPVARPAGADAGAPVSPATHMVFATPVPALSPATVQGAAYPSPVLDNTGPSVPGNFNIPGMPAVAPLTAKEPVPLAGPGFVPPQAAPTEDAALPDNAAPTEGVSPVTVAKIAQAQNAAAAPSSTAAVAPSAVPPAAVAKVAAAMPAATPAAVPLRSGLGAVNPAVLQALTSPYADESTKKIAGILLQQQMTPKEVHTQETDAAGNVWDVNRLTGQRTVALQRQATSETPYRDADGNLMQRDSTGKVSMLSAADKNPTSVNEYEYYKKNLPKGQEPIPYDVWSTAKARAAATSITNNVDMNSGQTYDKQLAEGLGKAHASLANGVEDSQSRARDIAAMQGAIDQIQKRGGTTGGLAPAARLELQKSINAGLAAVGIDKPFSEEDLSDKEFLTKFNRSMAGAQAKNAVGSRVTNFEMSNFLKANPGLDMTITGNQRLLGIQSQMEQRNIAVGNAIRNATAAAISTGKKIDPVTVQKIITDYDEAHHIQDPTTGQDLTQSYALPEFQNQGTNAALAAQHDKNMGPAEKVIGGKTYVKDGDHWYEKH